MASAKGEKEKQLMQVIAKFLDETRASYATHNRKLKDLRAVRSKAPSAVLFSSAFFKTLTPIFSVHRRTASSERVVSFVSAFAANNNDELLEDFFKFLLVAAVAANKTARFRACQIISKGSGGRLGFRLEGSSDTQFLELEIRNCC